MSIIRKMDPHLADLIAAGEVVERPGSVIKELMENSIDAGATSITVEIRGGGLTYMRVTDNGCGMSREDAQTAFLRHATSKLYDQKGLEAIGTLGFRGEALAAAAAVSKIELLTRETDGEEGTSLSIEGGVILSVKPAGCPEGTTMIVRDLFYNTPARQKFMKSDRAEGANITGIVARCALSHPELSVRYIKDGKEEYHTPGDGKIESCIYSLFGREFASSLLHVESEDDSVAVKGFVTSPAGCRGSRNMQFFFINGRFIRSKLIQAAVEQAYKNSLFTGKFPGCVIYIETSPAYVDVNIHPTKTEVKFMYEKQVFNSVYLAVRGALEAEEGRAEIKLPGKQIPKEIVRENRENTYSGSAPAHKSFGAAEKPSWERSFKEERAAFKAQFASEPRTYIKTEFNERAKVRDTSAIVYQTAINMPKPEIKQETAADVQIIAHEEENDLPIKLIGETLNTYILAEMGDSLYLIDKHAAHERMIFDKLKENNEPVMTQYLLSPIVCEMTPDDVETLAENESFLSELGFEADRFGERSIAVRRAPDDIDAADIRSTLEEICEKLKSSDSEDLISRRDDVLHTIACKAAIKAGKCSDPREMLVIAKKVLSGEVRYCPHGRPVAMELTRQSLSKNFKRS